MSDQTTASEIWLEAEPGATLSGKLSIYDGAPPIHITGFEITAQIDVEALAPLDISNCTFRGAAPSRRLSEANDEAVQEPRSIASNENAKLIVRSGHIMIASSDFEGLDRAIYVQGGTLVIANSTFRQNRECIYVTNGSVSIANTNFSTNLNGATALNVVGGDVVLKDQTLVEARGKQLALNISNGASVRYELPAPLGRYAFIQNNDGIYDFESGERTSDFPFECPAGTVGDSSTARNQSSPACSQVCPAGYHCGARTTVPTKCPVGSYCAIGSPAPTACKPGTFNRSEGLQSSEDCDLCLMGSWCSAGNAILCPRNTFQPLFSQSSAVACQTCPESSESPEGSTGKSACKCVEGNYDCIDGPDVQCEICPLGALCTESGHTLALLPLRPGYWRTNDHSSELKRCPDASSPKTTACANVNGSVCKPWTIGPYCRNCNTTDGSRYFDSVKSACVPCGDMARSLAAISGTVAAVMLLLYWCSWRQSCRYLGKVVYQALIQMRAPLKQMVAFYQVPDSCHASVRAHSLYPSSRPADCTLLLSRL